MVKDINTSLGFSSSPSGFAVLNGILYFSASDGAHGLELWRSDGSSAGTYMVADINPSADSSPSFLTPFGADLYFAATEPSHGRELWQFGDFSPPQTTIATHPVKEMKSKKKSGVKISFRFTSDEPGSTFSCKLDANAWKSCSSPKIYSVKVAKHSFQVRATDKYGNVDSSPAVWVWRVKLSKPAKPVKHVKRKK